MYILCENYNGLLLNPVTMKSFVICVFLAKYNYDDVKEGEMGMTCSTNREKENTYRIFVGKPEGKRPTKT
jgi:hypothetical protein